jgi:hypothetical protein
MMKAGPTQVRLVRNVSARLRTCSLGARAGVFDPDVQAAVKEARGRGVVVIIVDGRILSELRKAAGDLDLSMRWWRRMARFSPFQMVSPGSKLLR